MPQARQKTTDPKLEDDIYDNKTQAQKGVNMSHDYKS
jgi:hypothetical protein